MAIDCGDRTWPWCLNSNLFSACPLSAAHTSGLPFVREHPRRCCGFCVQAITFDNDGNLWVSGAGSMSLINIDPPEIGITWTNGAVGTTTIMTPGAAPIDLIAVQVCAYNTHSPT